MQRFLLAVAVLMPLGAVSASVAEAGCRCGRSYIADWKTCHKCPCECPSCDNSDCATPEARYTPIRMTLTKQVQLPARGALSTGAQR